MTETYEYESMCTPTFYKPLVISTKGTPSIYPALQAMRYPVNQAESYSMLDDLILAAKLIRRGEEHAKFQRGIVIFADMSFQVGFMVELDTYRIGTEVLSTSSSMHNELKGGKGWELADAKQCGLPRKVYKRIQMFSYQTLRRIHKQRRYHRHPDWQLFCDWIETLPWYSELIQGIPINPVDS